MTINLPWSEMEEKEELLWDRFLENYGYEMEDDELNFLEESYKRLTGSEDFEISSIMMYGRKKDDEEKEANNLFGL